MVGNFFTSACNQCLPPHSSGSGVHKSMFVTLNEVGSSPVAIARLLSMAAVAAKDQHDPHPPCWGIIGLTFPSFVQSTSAGRLEISSM